MNYEDIKEMYLLNEVDQDEVNKIAESIKKNGFVGCPILILNDELLTGSHRLAALNQLEDEEFYVDGLGEIAEDVTEIVEENMEKTEEELGYCPDIDYSNIGWLLEGSWVEDYKDEIVEW